MDDHSCISEFLSELVKKAPKDGIVLSRIPPLIRRELDPQYTIEKYGCKKLRDLVLKYLPDNAEIRADRLTLKEEVPISTPNTDQGKDELIGHLIKINEKLSQQYENMEKKLTELDKKVTEDIHRCRLDIRKTNDDVATFNSNSIQTISMLRHITTQSKWKLQRTDQKENLENAQLFPLPSSASLYKNASSYYSDHPECTPSSDTLSPNVSPTSLKSTPTPAPVGYKFIHEDGRFQTLLKMCSEDCGIDPSLIEKDYYTSHALWCLRKKGLEIQIKGGVSLAKGFGIINRLSEDVDIVIRPNDAGPPSFLQDVVHQLDKMDMKSKLKTRERAKLWIKFANMIKKSLPGLNVIVGCRESSPFYDPRWSYLVLHATYAPTYPVLDNHLLPGEIILEMTTSVDEPLDPIPLRLSSFLHTYLEKKHMLHQFKRNIPTVLCTHPLITLVQKISDGIVNRYQRPIGIDGPMPPFASGLRGKVPPFDPRIIRHYEDAAAIILNISKCHPFVNPSDYMKLYVQLMERRMVRRKLELGTTISGDESLLLLDKDQDKISSLMTCQQQRLCLHYNNKEGSNSRTSPPALQDCANIIREWLIEVGL